MKAKIFYIDWYNYDGVELKINEILKKIGKEKIIQIVQSSQKVCTFLTIFYTEND